MSLTIENAINKIEPYNDKIFYCPLNIDEIKLIEKDLKIKFPKSYELYLLKIGLFQDLIKGEMLETRSDLALEKTFINEIVRKNPELFFAFGRNGFGDLLLLKDDKENDNFIYKLSHNSGKITKTKNNFTDFIEKKIDKAIKDYKKRKLNSEKAWKVQFSFKAENEQVIFESLKKEFEVNKINDWEYVEETPAGVKEFILKFKLNNKELNLHKLEYKDWDLPNISFNYEEPVINLCTESKIDELHSLFNKKDSGYKLVNYGIL